MQIIQGIREKGAAIVIVVIALSLIGFILMDAKQGSGRMFSSTSSAIGKVNGSTIEKGEFDKRVNMLEAQDEQQNNGRPSTERIAQIRDQVWNQMVSEKVFYDESDKLGIAFTAKELSSILSSDDPSNPLMQEQSLKDPATGRLDQAKVSQALNRVKKMKPEERESFDAQVIEPQRLTSISQKYFALLNASVYYPSWMEEQDNKNSKNFAAISYVNIGYGVISDSSIKVTDEEINDYVQKHKSLFKQEAGRTISYVAFSQAPGANDSAQTRDQVTGLKENFATETNTASFIARNGSTIEFDSSYQPKSKLSKAIADTIGKLPVGVVFGPYTDNNNYTLVKVLGTKMMPDSVKARHILIATVDPQSGQPIIEDSVAKKRADSIFAAIKAGADFGQLAAKYGSDATKDKGGDLGYFANGMMVPEFNEYAFNHATGSKDVVRTRFGYHVMEITDQKGSSPAYKVAFLAKEILASSATINKASNEATKLSAENDPKKFDAYIAKNGLQKITVPNIIKENDYAVQNLRDARELVRWVFDARKGDVSEKQFNIDDKFIVAKVDNIYSKGTQDAAFARPMAEQAVRNEKRAAQIIAKLGANPTLESAAAAYGKPVEMAGQDSSITFTSKIINSIGDEPKLIGAAFNKENQSKVAVVTGKTGIYVMKVTGMGVKAADTPELAAMNKMTKLNELRSQSAIAWFDALKDRATIKDKRSDFF